MSNGKFLAGVITGLGAGTLLGILFAPDKGSKTRKKIIKACSRTTEEAKVNLHDVVRRNKEKLQQHAEETDLNSAVM